MSQVDSGIRSILAQPIVYKAFQSLVGSAAVTKETVRQLGIGAGDVMLDIGCGTATVLDYLPPCSYVGFDVSESYIEAARERYGERGKFYTSPVSGLDREQILEHAPYDLALAKGVLHHLSDEDAKNVCELAAVALRPGGRLVTVDPVLEKGQPRLARALVKRDRGMNVRSSSGYKALATGSFTDVDCTVRHDMLRMPYSHVFIRARTRA